MRPVVRPGRDEYQRRYDTIAAYHLDFWREHGRNPWMTEEPELRARTIANITEWVPPGSRLLDAGCGIGGMLEDLTALYETVGVDISAEYVDHARARGCDALVGWVEELPFTDSSFDAAVCCDVLEHVLDPAAAVAELRRVVRPGGILVVRVPDGDATGVGADSGFGFPVHLQQWCLEELHALLGGELVGSDSWHNELVVGVRR